ncbi:MAG: hypothetical protein KIS73_27755 [Enhydrobacter sp.]|nr:hypothetical protein [Enhydrobacter sp.]
MPSRQRSRASIAGDRFADSVCWNWPDEAREAVFPQIVPVVLLHSEAATCGRCRGVKAPGDADGSTRAEAGMASDAAMLKEQARRADRSGQGENFLAPTRAL